jgi:hypothetical protein
MDFASRLTRLRGSDSDVSGKTRGSGMRHACADSREHCSFLPLHGRGWQGRGQQTGLVAHLATQPRVALTPPLEAPRDGVEQPGFVETWA